ncbi:hypothetical protein JD969_01985 [Planctomycetota bacterium]|nr:hypothetical protein JD969_01985 [Planctomycetota bacterium]
MQFIFLFTLIIITSNISWASNRPQPLRQLTTSQTINVSNYRLPGMTDQQVIQAALNAAKIAGSQTTLRFEPNYKYQLGFNNKERYFTLTGYNHFILDGNGCEFNVGDLGGLFKINNSNNVIMQNFTVDMDTPAMSQGNIINWNQSTKTARVRVDAGYINPDHNWLSEHSTSEDKHKAYFIVKDKDGSGAHKQGTKNVMIYKNIAKGQDAGGDYYDISFNAAINVEAGDKFVMPASYTSMLAFPKNSGQITMKNINIYATTGAAIYSGESTINVLDTHIKIKPNSGRLLGSNRDGFIVRNPKWGPWIENSTFEATGDDGINIASNAETISTLNTNNQLTISTKTQINVGDQIAILNKHTMEVVYQGNATSKSNKTITLNTNLPIEIINSNNLQEDYLVYDLDVMADGFVIKNSEIKYSRRYGLLIAAKNGLIENNLFEKTAATAIAFEQENKDHGIGSFNMTVRNNIFDTNFIQTEIFNRPEVPHATAIGTWTSLDQNSNRPSDNYYFYRNFNVYDNLFKGTASDKGYAFYNEDASTFQVYNNDFMYQWTEDANGTWSDHNNWDVNNEIPNGNNRIAYFGNINSSTRTITLASSQSIKGLLLDSPNKYKIIGSPLIMQSNSSIASIDALQGSHIIHSDIQLNHNTEFFINSSTYLSTHVYSGDKDIIKLGDGLLRIYGNSPNFTGSINVHNGRMFIASDLRNAKGVNIHGNGTLMVTGHTSTINNHSGTLSPGNTYSASGQFEIHGNYTQSSNATLLANFNSTNNVITEDSIIVNGSANIDGTLKLLRINNASPQLNDSFLLMTTSNGITGTFSSIQNTIISNSLAFAITYTSNTINAQVALMGDANLDGIINQLDLNIVHNNLSSLTPISLTESSPLTWIDGDFNGDGIVNNTDLNLLTNNPIFIPEPTTTALSLFLLAPLALLRQRNAA